MCVFLEASQIYEPLALGPILLSNRFVMFGDYYTLNPLCKSQEADKLGMTIPLHRRLSENFPKKVILLRTQYRMSTHISQLLNNVAYKGLIRSNQELDPDS